MALQQRTRRLRVPPQAVGIGASFVDAIFARFRFVPIIVGIMMVVYTLNYLAFLKGSGAVSLFAFYFYSFPNVKRDH